MPKQLHHFTVGDIVRVRAAVAPMMTESRASASLSSQLTAGHLLSLLDQRGDWWLVRSEDEYEGWVHRGYLEPSTGDERDWPVTTGAMVRRADGVVRALPFGARVAPDAMLLSGDAYDDDERARLYPPDHLAVAQSAQKYFTGASYLWGGVTPWGTDCSGFVQAIASLHGHELPRDAWQQASVGVRVGGEVLDALALQPADLLFFSDREDERITHVAMQLSNERFVHSAIGRGGVSIESVRDSDDYVRQLVAQFVVARRFTAS